VERRSASSTEYGKDFGSDRQRDFRGGLGANISADRCVHALDPCSFGWSENAAKL
jgi:hypothetical protein